MESWEQHSLFSFCYSRLLPPQQPEPATDDAARQDANNFSSFFLFCYQCCQLPARFFRSVHRPQRLCPLLKANFLFSHQVSESVKIAAFVDFQKENLRKLNFTKARSFCTYFVRQLAFFLAPFWIIRPKFRPLGTTIRTVHSCFSAKRIGVVLLVWQREQETVKRDSLTYSHNILSLYFFEKKTR